MSRPTYPRLFEPGRIGGMETKNRLVRSSVCDNMSDRGGAVTDQKVAYFRRKAQGGVGWINLGYAYVSARGRGCTHYMSGIYGDELIGGLRRLAPPQRAEGLRAAAPVDLRGRGIRGARPRGSLLRRRRHLLAPRARAEQDDARGRIGSDRGGRCRHRRDGQPRLPASALEGPEAARIAHPGGPPRRASVMCARRGEDPREHCGESAPADAPRRAKAPGATSKRAEHGRRRSNENWRQ